MHFITKNADGLVSLTASQYFPSNQLLLGGINVNQESWVKEQDPNYKSYIWHEELFRTMLVSHSPSLSP